jgi:hypothetical protein
MSFNVRKDNMPDLIHIYYKNQQEGPYSPEQIQDMIAKGVVTPVTLAWKEGMSDWAPLNTIVSCVARQQVSMPQPPPIAQPAPQTNVTSPSIAGTGPKGIGGWLLFFCVSLTILSPLNYLYRICKFSLELKQSQLLLVQFPNLKTAAMWEFFGIFAILLYGFIVGCMIWNRNPNGRKIAKKFLLIRLFGLIGIVFISIIIMGDMPFKVVASVIGSAVSSIFLNFIWFLIWWFYFKRSKRVRNTYGAN